MANNRIFILNKETNKATLLAKSFGNGWEIRASTNWLERFMSSDDWGSSCCGGPSRLVLMTESQLPDDCIFATEVKPRQWWKFWD